MLALLPLKRYFQFRGRSSRAEYWQFLALVVAAIVVAILVPVDGSGDGPPPIPSLILLASIVPTYAVTFRRLHDRGYSGWFVGGIWALNVLSFVLRQIVAGLHGSILAWPFVLIEWVSLVATMAVAGYLFYQMCLPGDPAANRFGPPPHAADEIAATELRATLAAAKERARELAPRTAVSDPIEQIERLSKLHREGSLTDGEFESQKAAVLKGPRS